MSELVGIGAVVLGIVLIATSRLAADHLKVSGVKKLAGLGTEEAFRRWLTFVVTGVFFIAVGAAELLYSG